MFKWFKKLYHEIKTTYLFYRCYKETVKLNLQTYTLNGVCAGHGECLERGACEHCPYFRDIRDNDDWA